jgi:cystathionine gamma-synthase
MTMALHGTHSEHICHAHVFPIFQTSTFMFDSVQHGADLFAGKTQGHIYTRISNPTVQEVEKLICKMEGGEASLAFGSGMGAISSSVWSCVKAGDHVIWGDTLYGCSVNFFTNIVNYGIEATPTDTSDLEVVRKNIRNNTRLIYLESPANPTNRVTDIAAICALAKEHNILVIIDGTFSSPIFLRPLALGADIFVHSVTKYINGHGDALGGCAKFKTKELCAKAASWRKDNGSLMSPLNAFLVHRGLKTLPIRMARVYKNAIAVAEFLEKHPKITKVLYPALKSFPQHEIAMKQQSGFGGTFSFLMAGGFEAAKKICSELHLFGLAVSLGTLDSLIEHPASMTHSAVPPEVMEQQHLTDNLVRVSIGLEEPEDLIADLEQALEKC